MCDNKSNDNTSLLKLMITLVFHQSYDKYKVNFVILLAHGRHLKGGETLGYVRWMSLIEGKDMLSGYKLQLHLIVM